MAQAQARAEVLSEILWVKFGLHSSFDTVAAELSRRPDQLSVLRATLAARSITELLGPREHWQLSFLDHYVNVLESSANRLPIHWTMPLCDAPAYAKVHRPTVWHQTRVEILTELLRELYGERPDLLDMATRFARWTDASDFVSTIMRSKNFDDLISREQARRRYLVS
jgi:hypothetical protein